MYKITLEQIKDVANRTGLELDTVEDLLEKGWMFTEKYDTTHVWVSNRWEKMQNGHESEGTA